MDKKVVFDFDKTLIRINSFTHWIFFIWSNSFLTLELRLFFAISRLIFKRKISRNLSHELFKREIILLEYPPDYCSKFSKKLYPYLNKDVMNYLEYFGENNYQIAISSAAPEIYLKEFIQNYITVNQFLVVGATIEEHRLNDNFGENKVENLIKKGFLDSGEKFDVLFTDSFDDKTLAGLAKEIYLISPDEKSKAEFFKFFPEKIKRKE